MKVMEVMNPRPDQILANNFNMFQTVKSIEKVLLLYWTFQLEIIQSSPWQKNREKMNIMNITSFKYTSKKQNTK